MEEVERLSVRAAQDPNSQSIREELDAMKDRLMNALDLVGMYAIVSDFSNAAQWLKIYDGGELFEETVKTLVINKHPMLPECFETLSNLPRVRVEIERIRLTLNRAQTVSV